MGYARRINVAAIGLKHDAADAVKVHKGMQTLCLVATNFVEIHAVAACLGGLYAQLMLAGFGLCQIQRAGLEYPATLPRLGLQFLVQTHRIMLQTADVGDVVQTVDVGGGMPSRPCSQFGPLQ